eukprot:scaffold18472_cov101-Isochrysis_galbana.AAC.2
MLLHEMIRLVATGNTAAASPGIAPKAAIGSGTPPARAAAAASANEAASWPVATAGTAPGGRARRIGSEPKPGGGAAERQVGIVHRVEFDKCVRPLGRQPHGHDRVGRIHRHHATLLHGRRDELGELLLRQPGTHGKIAHVEPPVLPRRLAHHIASRHRRHGSVHPLKAIPKAFRLAIVLRRRRRRLLLSRRRRPADTGALPRSVVAATATPAPVIPAASVVVPSTPAVAIVTPWWRAAAAVPRRRAAVPRWGAAVPRWGAAIARRGPAPPRRGPATAVARRRAAVPRRGAAVTRRGRWGAAESRRRAAAVVVRSAWGTRAIGC